MPAATKPKPGTRVRFTSNSLGAVHEDSPYRFVDRHYGSGDTGTVIDASLGDGEMAHWFYVRPDDQPDGDKLLVPCHTGLAEVIT